MMKTLVFGSCNLDFIYKVANIVSPGETMGISAVAQSPGGKGLNQAVALKRAGMDVAFAGCIGADGAMLKALLSENGVDVSRVKTVEDRTGQAHIQVTETGENAILLYRGANYQITRKQIDETLADYAAGDLLLLQNEISELDYLIDAAFRKGMKIVLNPSPISEEMKKIDYGKLWLIFVNEVEVAGLTGGGTPEDLINDFRRRFPALSVVVTLGAAGSLYFDGKTLLRQPALPANPVDTTCAGDTFEGYFTAALCGGCNEKTALLRGAAAASIVISRIGAAGMIPTKAEVDELLENL